MVLRVCFFVSNLEFGPSLSSCVIFFAGCCSCVSLFDALYCYGSEHKKNVRCISLTPSSILIWTNDTFGDITLCQLNFLLWKRNSRASVIKALAFPVFENNTCTVGIVDSCFPFYCMDLVIKSMACFLFLCVFSFFHCLVRPWMMKTNMVAFETGMWISFPSLLWLKVHDHQSLFNLMDDDFLSSDYSFYSGFLQYVCL